MSFSTRQLARRRATLALIFTALALAALLGALLAGCGLGRGGPEASRGDASVSLGLQIAGETPASPSRISVRLTAAGAEELYQLSCRVAYNPDALRFVGAERGGLADSRSVYFTRGSQEYVAIAFTYHIGERIPAPTGTVATLHFDVLDAQADPGLALIDDPDFLIARDSARRPIDIELEVGR